MMRFDDNPNKPEMSGKEYRTLCFALMAASELEHFERDFSEDRTKLIGNFGKRTKNMATQMHNLVDEIIDHTPYKQLERLHKEMPYLVHEIKLKAAATPPAEWVFVKSTDINQLFKVVIEDKCRYCPHAMGMDAVEEREIKNCELRKSLMAIQAPYELDGYGCPYGRLTWSTKSEMNEAIKKEEDAAALAAEKDKTKKRR